MSERNGDSTLTLPPVEAVDAVDVGGLPALLAQLSALAMRAAVRMGEAGVPPTSAGDGPAYTLEEAAALIRKSPTWLRRRARAGRIPGAQKNGRDWTFPRARFDRLRERGMGG